MAVSAFKSTSKRGNLASSSSNLTCSTAKGSNSDKNSSSKMQHRRSRSVSAVSRSSMELPSSSSDFLNKRDNPLFCTSTSSPPDVSPPDVVGSEENFVQNVSKIKELAKKPVVTEVLDSRRGRSVSRNAEFGNGSLGARKEMGQSLSRVDLGRRRRSVSRGHDENPKSEKEHKSCPSSSLHNQNNRNQMVNMKKVARDSESSSRGRNLQASSRHNSLSHGFFSCFQDTNWEDGISTSSFSEAEEKTIKAVFEQIENHHPAGDAGAGEIYEAIRSEVRLAISQIQNDLKMSEERAGKLRADLAVEEHRGQELGRILKEILPEPKVSETRHSRFRRKNSSERRKMSKSLTEEAMNYFDECVSISTFDSSDFSSTEDPPVGLVAAAPLVDKNVCFPPSASSNQGIHGHLNNNKRLDGEVQSKHQYESPDLTRGSSSMDPAEVQNHLADLTAARSQSFLFSSAHNSVEVSEIHCGIRNYIKKFEKRTQTNARDFRSARSSYYYSDDYELQIQDEMFLLDRVIFSNRIESGSLLLCGMGL